MASDLSELDDFCCARYEPVAAVHNIRALPRFGLTKNFTQLVADDDGKRVEYIWGAVLISIILLIVLAVWTVVLVVFPCLGKSRVGFLSGSRLVVQKGVPNRRPTLVRIFFLISAGMVIAFTVLLGTMGLRNLYNTTEAAYETTLYVQNLLVEASDTLTALEEVGAGVINASQTVLGSVSDFCPAGGEEVTQVARGFSNALSYIQQYSNDFVDHLRDTLNGIGETTVTMQNAVETVDQNLVFEMIYRIPLLVFTVLLIIGLGLAWAEKSSLIFERIQRYITMPIFILWILLSWVLACVFSIAAIVNSDACSGGPAPGSPGDTVIEVLQVNVDPGQAYDLETQLRILLVKYYFGCDNAHPFANLTEIDANLTYAVDEGQQFLQVLTNVGNDACASNVTLVGDESGELISLMLGMINAIGAVIALLACINITPIYSTLFNDTICTYNVTALAWIMGSLIVISVCGMVMIMLRSAVRTVKYVGTAADGLDDHDAAVAAVPVVDDSSDAEDVKESATSKAVGEAEKAFDDDAYSTLPSDGNKLTAAAQDPAADPETSERSKWEQLAVVLPSDDDGETIEVKEGDADDGLHQETDTMTDGETNASQQTQPEGCAWEDIPVCCPADDATETTTGVNDVDGTSSSK